MVMRPEFHPVKRRRQESSDVVTLEVAAQDRAFQPGEFNMLYAFGVGDVAISISGDPANHGTITHTLRAVGAVTRALAQLRPGDRIGLRGPFGRGWPLQAARGKQLLLIAGGIGLAPLRPVIYHFMRHAADYDSAYLLYGTRQPEDILFQRELLAWSGKPGFRYEVTVDYADDSWQGHVGVITPRVAKIPLKPGNAVAMLCGPEVMLRFSVEQLLHRGMRAEDIFVSLERNMKCGIGLCGHCQYGPHFICKDGPVFALSAIETWFGRSEI